MLFFFSFFLKVESLILILISLEILNFFSLLCIAMMDGFFFFFLMSILVVIEAVLGLSFFVMSLNFWGNDLVVM